MYYRGKEESKEYFIFKGHKVHKCLEDFILTFYAESNYKEN